MPCIFSHGWNVHYSKDPKNSNYYKLCKTKSKKLRVIGVSASTVGSV